jgi:hypothetical protein
LHGHAGITATALCPAAGLILIISSQLVHVWQTSTCGLHLGCFASPCVQQEDRKLSANAAWANSTDKRIQQNQLQERFATLKAQADAALAARQDRLAEKLHAEEQALKQELISCQETPAQRRAQMAARAHELAKRR